MNCDRHCGDCPACIDARAVTPSGPGLKSHRAFLAPRMPEAKWLKLASPYVWPLWRNWKPPKPITVETTDDVTRWLLAYKPAGYSWRLWHQHKAAKPKPAVQATPTRVAA